MKMNRRKALIGIGSLAVGSGAALGSGAFTSVEADRTVTVETANDLNAYLTLTGDDQYINDDSGGGALIIDLGSPSNPALNKDAVTKISGIVTINHNNQDGNTPKVGINDATTGSYTIGLDTETDSNPVDVTFNLSTNENTFTDSGSASPVSNFDAYLDVKVDTTVETKNGNSGPITIVADDS